MIVITFPDRETEKQALAFLLGRFSARVLRTGEHLVPEAALEALAEQSITFTVKGKPRNIPLASRSFRPTAAGILAHAAPRAIRP